MPFIFCLLQSWTLLFVGIVQCTWKSKSYLSVWLKRTEHCSRFPKIWGLLAVFGKSKEGPDNRHVVKDFADEQQWALPFPSKSLRLQFTHMWDEVKITQCCFKCNWENIQRLVGTVTAEDVLWILILNLESPPLALPRVADLSTLLTEMNIRHLFL